MKILKTALFIACSAMVISCQARQANTEEVSAEAAETSQSVAPADAVQLPASDAEFRPGMKVKEPTIVDFNATWCGPCRYLKPSFDKAADTYKGKMRFVSLDVDKFPLTANAFKVQAIPTLMIFMPDGTTTTIVGLNDFIKGLDESKEPTQEELDALIYSNFCKIIDKALK